MCPLPNNAWSAPAVAQPQPRCCACWAQRRSPASADHHSDGYYANPVGGGGGGGGADDSSSSGGGGGGGGRWLGAADGKARRRFVRELGSLGLPSPRTPGEFHAARVFDDRAMAHTYDVEQWTDYLEIKGIV